MGMTKFKTSATVLVTSVAVTVGGLLAQQPLAPKAGSPATEAAVSAEMAQTEAKVAQVRELVRPQPGEYLTNVAKIAWERDPWEAAVRAGKEGKPVIAYGPGMVGVPCGYG